MREIVSVNCSHVNRSKTSKDKTNATTNPPGSVVVRHSLGDRVKRCTPSVRLSRASNFLEMGKS